MHKKIIFFLVLFISNNFLFSIEVKNDHYIENLNDFIGETLHYKVSYFKIHAGDALLKMQKTKYKGKDSIKFTGIIKSASWFRYVYFVEDHITVYIDPQNLKPLEIIVDYKEGEKYKRNESYIFNYEKNLLETNNKPPKKLPNYFCDMFTAFYLTRTFDFSNSKLLHKKVTDGRKFYTAVVSKTPNINTLKTALGKKECFSLIPKHIRMDLFGLKQKPEMLIIYYTNDQFKIPVLAKGKIRIGKIKAELKKYTKK